MQTGLMWFDNDPRTALAVKIEKASDYYKRKFGRLPDLCLVNPSMLGDSPVEMIEQRGVRITIRPYRPVLPGHLWIGVEDEKA
ncbi:MAG TPA: hypothetical protein VIU39_04005 [Anaerolineales bacterium]